MQRELVNYDIEMTLQVVVMENFTQYTEICLHGLRKFTKNFRQNKQSSDFNGDHPSTQQG
jgi:hypothetical protein